jgi:hypothetical protein
VRRLRRRASSAAARSRVSEEIAAIAERAEEFKAIKPRAGFAPRDVGVMARALRSLIAPDASPARPAERTSAPGEGRAFRWERWWSGAESNCRLRDVQTEQASRRTLHDSRTLAGNSRLLLPEPLLRRPNGYGALVYVKEMLTPARSWLGFRFGKIA